MMDYMNKFSLKKKVAFVTGGAGLIGGEVSKSLASAGAHMVILDKDKRRGMMLAKEIVRYGGKCSFECFDITEVETLDDNLREWVEKYKAVDVWVNAAYPRTENWGKTSVNMDIVSWRANIDMHLNGYLICCQKVAEYMKKKKMGSIINFASIYGIVGPEFSIYKGTGVNVPAAYSAIKGGIISFTRYLASYYGKYNVRVNSISPGGVLDKQHVKFVKRYSEKTPLRRMADKEDIAGSVIYLASDAGSYVTGHNLVVDGGWSIV